MILFAGGPRPFASATAAAATNAPPSIASAGATEPCGTLGGPTTTVYLPNITKTLGGPSGWVTPFIVQNIGAQPTVLEVSFFRFADGSLVTCRKVSGLAPGTSFADVPNNDTDLPSDTQFSVVVRSYGAQVVSVVNEHQGLGTPARAEALSYVGLTSGATRIGLPYVAKQVGGWLTTFVTQNLGTALANVTATFSSADGTKTATLTRQIGPGRSQFVDPTVEPSLLAGTEYAVVLTSDQPIAVIANAHNDLPTVAAPMGFSYNGVPAGSSAPVYLPLMSRNTDGIGRTSRLLIENLAAADTAPILSFQRLGVPGTITLAAPQLKPGRAWSFDPRFAVDGQSACPVAGAAACLGEGEYSLVVTGGQFAVVDALTSPATGMAFVGATAVGNRAYLPNVTRTLGGVTGWTTPFLIESAGAISATARWYRFADGALVTRQAIPSLAAGVTARVDPRFVEGLADDTQYAVVIDAQGGNLAAVVTELNFQGGDGAMAYEGFAATVSTIPTATAITVTPASATLSTGGTLQLSASVRDQFDNVLTGQPVSWNVVPTTLGTITPSGAFTSGASAGVGSLIASSGGASANVAITVSSVGSVTVGGISFTFRATSTSDVYTEATISTIDAQTLAVQVDLDVARVQQDYGRVFAARPRVYVLATTATYLTAQTTILQLPSTNLASGEGVFYVDKVALDWSRLQNVKPVTAPRHELTHMMIQQIAVTAAVPAWVNEGSARLEEFTVAGSQWWQAVNRYGALSMAASGQLFTIADLVSQGTWNQRVGSGIGGSYQYHEAQQAAQFLRDDIGLPGVINILTRMSQGQTYDQAYLAVSGTSSQTFAAAFPARLAALGSSTGLALTADSQLGTSPNGPGYVLYGYVPNSTVTLNITGAASGFTNTNKAKQVDQYGVYVSALTSEWPPDTYTFTVTAPNLAPVTRTFTKTR